MAPVSLWEGKRGQLREALITSSLSSSPKMRSSNPWSWRCPQQLPNLYFTPTPLYDVPGPEAGQHSGFPISCPPEGCWHMRVPQEGPGVYPGLLPPGILWGSVQWNPQEELAALRSEPAIILMTESLQTTWEGHGWRREMKGQRRVFSQSGDSATNTQTQRSRNATAAPGRLRYAAGGSAV